MTKKKKPCGCDKGVYNSDFQELLLTFNGMRRGVKLGLASRCCGCGKWVIHPRQNVFVEKDEQE